MILLDTNVLSEVLRPEPSKVVLSWLAAQEPLSIFTTTITQAEILYGIELLPAGKRQQRLAAAVEQMFDEEFESRILAFDAYAASAYAKIVAGSQAAGRPISQFDGLIAAVVRSRRAALATRNIADFERCGIRVINPWKA